MYTCIKVSTKCINSLQRSSISSLEKKCRDRFYSKAKTLYFEVTDDSLIKLVFHPLSSETRKVRKGFESAGNGRKKPSVHRSKHVSRVSSCHTHAHTSKRYHKRRRDREGLPPPPPQPTD